MIDNIRFWEGAMRKVYFVTALLLLSTSVVAQQVSMSFEPDTDRPGANLRVLDLDKADPQLCAEICQANQQCRSYTYVKPGVQGPKARCWLKSGVPAAKQNKCCVSGVKATQSGGAPPAQVPVVEGRPKATGPMTVEQDTDRPGANLRVLDLDKADPQLCAEVCQANPQCRAYTYVKPGVQGPKARCWLKSSVPAAKPNRCCVSGVKTAGSAPGQPTVPMQTMPGTMGASPMQPAPTAQTPTTGSHPAMGPSKFIDLKAKIPPASARRPGKPLNRGELVTLLLANPRTAPGLSQVASTMGMPAQQLATQSTSGKMVTGEPIPPPSSSDTKNWNWEAGVRFTPKSKAWDLRVSGVLIQQEKGYDISQNKIVNIEYGLSDMYQNDELYLVGEFEDVYISFIIDTPPGDFVITVEIDTELGVDTNLVYECPLCISQSLLFPVLDKKAIAKGHPSTYIGSFQVGETQSPDHVIRIPKSGWGGSSGVFRGITITRL